MKFTHNNRRHAEQKHTPFKLILGDNHLCSSNIPTYKISEHWRKDKMHDTRKRRSLSCTWISQNKNGKSGTIDLYSVWKGQKVWLDTWNFKTNHHMKITPKWEGPFKIEERLGPITYWLKLPETWKIHNVFHATLLRLYIENKIYGNNYPIPPAKLLEGEEVYEVDSILKHRRRGRGYQYYIKWKGNPITEATWENESAFSENGDMLEQYKLQNQL